MKEVRKILAPTDFSENSRAGLEFALSLAAELLVLHVASKFQVWEPYSDEAALISADVHPRLAGELVREATLDLNRFLEKHRDEVRRVRMLRKRVVLGSAAKKIVEVAEEEKADLIVMSRRLGGAIRQLFLGSVTDKVTRMAQCPVLTVPQQIIRPWGGKLVPALLLPLHQERVGA